MRVRKKPIEVEAVRYEDSKEGLAEVLRFTKGWRLKGGVRLNNKIVIIPTLEGDHEAQPGDWIIRGIAGEFYPCKSDIFEQTYEILNANP